MKTIEEIFLETKDVFMKQATEAAQEALDVIYTEYLPHVEADTQSNQYFQISEWLTRFFSGQLEKDDIKVDLTRWDAEKARQLIYEANKDEIIEALGKDFQKEIQYLNERLNTPCQGYF